MKEGLFTRFFRTLLAVFFILAGLNHFRDPGIYISMIPSWVPAPGVINVIAGGVEIAGGVGVMIRCVRIPAAWMLIALLVAIFPANLHVAMHGWPETGIARWVLWVRLPLQALFIGWVYIVCLHKRASAPC